MYFRFLESMGLPWISMRRKSFKGRQRYGLYDASPSSLTRPSTTDRQSNPRMFICCRKLSIIYCPYHQSERSKSRLQVDHLYIWRNDAEKINQTGFFLLSSSYMFDVNFCSFKLDFKLDYIFSYKLSRTIHIRKLRSNWCFKTVSKQRIILWKVN